MNFRPAVAAMVIGVVGLSAVVCAADRRWQTGMWTAADTKRQMIDFGPGATPFERGSSTPALRALADVSTYVIETADLRLELRDVAPIGRRSSLVAVVGQPVVFALEKNSLYVRDANGIEHKLRVTKKAAKVGR
jgi:hypothetical protein